MTTPRPPLQYDPRWASAVKAQLDSLETRVHQKGRDVEVGPGRLILTAPDGSRFVVQVNIHGHLSTAPL